MMTRNDYLGRETTADESERLHLTARVRYHAERMGVVARWAEVIVYKTVRDLLLQAPAHKATDRAILDVLEYYELHIPSAFDRRQGGLEASVSQTPTWGPLPNGEARGRDGKAKDSKVRDVLERRLKRIYV